MAETEGHSPREGNDASPGTAAIKWGAVVIIVVAILWFLARYVIPLFSRG